LAYLSFGQIFNQPNEHKNAVYSQIHEIVFHGNGGYTWQTVYDMPLWVRRFTFRKIQEHYEEQNKPTGDNGTTKTVIDENGVIKAPEFLQQHMQQQSEAKKPVSYQ
jgi:hypothetical protein